MSQFKYDKLQECLKQFELAFSFIEPKIEAQLVKMIEASFVCGWEASLLESEKHFKTEQIVLNSKLRNVYETSNSKLALYISIKYLLDEKNLINYKELPED